MSTKIYCDIADIVQIKKFTKKKDCQGVYYKSKFDAKSWSKRLHKIF